MTISSWVTRWTFTSIAHAICCVYASSFVQTRNFAARIFVYLLNNCKFQIYFLYYLKYLIHYLKANFKKYKTFTYLTICTRKAWNTITCITNGCVSFQTYSFIQTWVFTTRRYFIKKIFFLIKKKNWLSLFFLIWSYMILIWQFVPE